MRKRPDGQGGSGLEGPPGLPKHLPPKPEPVCPTILCLSPTLLTLTAIPTTLLPRNQLALVNKSPEHEKSVSTQASLWQQLMGSLSTLVELSTHDCLQLFNHKK